MRRLRVPGARASRGSAGSAWRRIAPLFVLASCGGRQPGVIGPGDLRSLAPASGAPAIAEVVDLGGVDVPRNGAVEVDRTDGQVVVGETLWIRGSDFGRQVAVEVGGRPAEVLGRTNDGGAIVRVPPAIGTGPRGVVVTNEYGRDQLDIDVHRLVALVPPEGGRIAWVDLAERGFKLAGVTEVAGAHEVAISPDGRAAYALDRESGQLAIVDIAGKVGPATGRRVDVKGPPIVTMCVAARAAVGALVRRESVQVLDLTTPLNPARRPPQSLPPEIVRAGVVAADLSPDGRWLALALGAGNRVAIVGVGAAGSVPVLAEVAVAPEQRVRVLVDVAWSAAGDTIWVLQGDTADSAATGAQATRAYAVRVNGGETGSESSGAAPGEPGATARRVEAFLARTVDIPEAHHPVRIIAGRSRPLQSGAAIRLPPEKVTVWVTAGARDPDRPTAGHAVFRIGAEAEARRIANATEALGAGDVTPDGRWVMAAAAGADGGFRLVAAPADGRGDAQVVLEILAAPARAATAGGAGAGDVRVQP